MTSNLPTDPNSGPGARPAASASPWRSLSTRLSLSAALLFLAGMGSLGWYASRTLQQDTEALLGQQQLSTASLLAAQLNQALAERIQALEAHAAAQAADGARAGPAGAVALQARLDANPELRAVFNGGVWISDVAGTVVASTLPVLLGRNYADRDYVIAVLKGEKSAIGKPVIGKVMKDPIFAMAVPVHDAQGRVVGVLAGVTDLSKPGFLDAVAGGRYGQTGGYVLVEWQHRLIITATDKRLVMSLAPPPGASDLVDRYMAGYEGPGVLVNALGVELLSAARRVELAPWYVAVAMPTEEAFAPLRAMQRRIAIGTLGIGLLAALLVAWLTRRQLAPLRAAAQVLAAPQGARLEPLPLPPRRDDEVATLIKGFNEVLVELARREALLRANEQGLATTLDSIGDAVIATDLAGRVTRMNPVATRLTGWPLAEALGRPLTEVFRIVSTLTGLPAANPVHRALEHGQVVGLANHTTLLARDGSEYQIADSAAPIRNGEGDIAGVVLVFSDVSEKYRAEAALARTRELLESTGALAGVGGWQVDLQTMNLSWTLETFRIAEMEPTHAPPLEAGIDLFAPEARPIISAAVQAAIDSGTPYDLELPWTGAKGRPRWVRTQGQAEMRDGKAVRLYGTLLDITEAKRAQAALQASEARARAIINASPVPMAMNDPGGNITFLNPAFTQTFGYTAAEIPTLDEWWPLAYPDPAYRQEVAASWAAELARSHRTETPFTPMALTIRRQDGTDRFVLVGAAALADAFEGSHLVVLHDITERHIAELALQSSLAEKTALLKEVHHRVKNNLQVVSSLLRLESGRSGHAPTQAVLADMQGRIRAMALLHESIYRSGTLASIDLGNYIRQVATQAFRSLQTSAPAAQPQPQLRLELGSVQAGLDQATPCGLLLTELVSNALKHGFPDGAGDAVAEVVIALQPVPGGAADLWCLRVSDNGVGLPAGFAARQQDSLGLQLVASLALQLGGSLVVGAGGDENAAAVAEAPGKAPGGAVFSVTFVVTPPAPLVLAG